MNKIDTGGQAFPCDLTAYDPEVQREMQGMTLRDYFAAKAMQGLLAQSQGTALGSTVETAANYAYAMADAMLKERNKSE